MKRFLIILIAIVTALSLSACLFAKPQSNTAPGFSSNDDEDDEDDEDDNNQDAGDEDDDNQDADDEDDDSQDADGEDANDQDADDDDDADVSEGVVFVDEGDIKISTSALEFSDEYWGPEMKLLVENDTDQNITAQIRYTAVNGLMVAGSFYCDVQAGKKANETFYITTESLTMSDIETIEDITFVFEVYDTDSWDTIIMTDPLSFSVADTSYEQQIDDTGETVVDNGDYKVIVQELDTVDTYYGADLYVYIENNTDKMISISTDAVSVNGFMIYPYFYCDILPGMKAFTPITFFETDLTDNDITDIAEIELIFYFYDEETWETLYESDTITLTF